MSNIVINNNDNDLFKSEFLISNNDLNISNRDKDNSDKNKDKNINNKKSNRIKKDKNNSNINKNNIFNNIVPVKEMFQYTTHPPLPPTRHLTPPP